MKISYILAWLKSRQNDPALWKETYNNEKYTVWFELSNGDELLSDINALKDAAWPRNLVNGRYF